MMSLNLFRHLQTFSPIFLGLNIETIKQIIKKHPDIEHADQQEWINIFEQNYYYVLSLDDLELKRKFQHNINLSKRKNDREFCDFLQELLVEFGGELMGDLWELEDHELKIKPTPEITKKKKAIKKPRGKNFQQTKPEPLWYTPSQRLKNFLTQISGDINIYDQIDIKGVIVNEVELFPTYMIKLILNKYILIKNLQDMNHRMQITLNKPLKELFHEERNNTSIITYHELKNWTKKHLCIIEA